MNDSGKVSSAMCDSAREVAKPSMTALKHQDELVLQ